jgi:hypothetical protein
MANLLHVLRGSLDTCSDSPVRFNRPPGYAAASVFRLAFPDLSKLSQTRQDSSRRGVINVRKT